MAQVASAYELPLAGRKLNLSVRHLLFGILLVAALLRVANLGQKSLWLDEAYSAVTSQMPRAAEFANIDPSRPPLHLTLLHYWTQTFGNGEAAVRMPSVLVSLINIWLLFILARRLFDSETALLAAALLALSPLDIWYAQEARTYLFVTCAGLLIALGLTWETWYGGLLYLLGLLLGLFVDYISIPLWAGLSVLWLLYWWQRGRPLMPMVYWLAGTVAAWLIYRPWTEPLRLLIEERLHILFIIERVRDLLGIERILLSHLLVALAGSALLLLVAALVLQWMLRRARPRQIITMLALVAFVLVMLSLLVPRVYSVKRVLVTGWPFVILLVAWMIMQLRAWRRPVAAGLLVLSLLVSMASIFFVPKQDWRGTAAFLAGRAEEGELIWPDPRWNRVPLRYYQPELAIPEEQGRWLIENRQADFAGVWLVAERYPGQQLPTSVSERWLDNNWILIEAFPFTFLEVRYYERP